MQFEMEKKKDYKVKYFIQDIFSEVPSNLLDFSLLSETVNICKFQGT